MFDKYCYKGYIYEASKELELDVPDIHEKIQKLIDEIIRDNTIRCQRIIPGSSLGSLST